MEEVESLHRYTCAEGYYNPAATLLFTSGEKTIEHLFSRGTHYEVGPTPPHSQSRPLPHMLQARPSDPSMLFCCCVVVQLDYGPVCTLLIFYFLLACYTSGMAQASGIMVPSLLIGGQTPAHTHPPPPPYHTT